MVQIAIKRTVNQVRLLIKVSIGAEISTSSSGVHGFIREDRMAAEPKFTSHMKTPDLNNSNDSNGCYPMNYLSLICRPMKSLRKDYEMKGTYALPRQKFKPLTCVRRGKVNKWNKHTGRAFYREPINTKKGLSKQGIGMFYLRILCCK